MCCTVELCDRFGNSTDHPIGGPLEVLERAVLDLYAINTPRRCQIWFLV